MKQKMIDYFFKVAELTSELSTCQSKQVGAVLVKDKRILAIGYNGTPQGKSHCNSQVFTDREKHHAWSLSNELHAEQNLISFCSKNGINTNKCDLFTTLSPCVDCSKMILASGIRQVFYINIYDKDPAGLLFLKRNNVNCYAQDEDDD